VTVFRVDSFKNLPKTIKNQNTKFQTSGFTRGSIGLAKGAIQKFEVLLQIKGDTVFEGSGDSETHLDRNGKRWISPSDWYEVKSMNKYVDFMIVEITKFLAKNSNLLDYIEKNSPSSIFSNNKIIDYDFLLDPSKPSIAKQKFYSEFIPKLSGKDKSKLIKKYLDLSKEFIEKNPSIILEIEKSGHLIMRGEFTNDEVLVHNYKIEKYWFNKNTIFETWMNTNNLWNEFTNSELPESKFIEKYENNFLKFIKGIQKHYKLENIKFCGFVDSKDVETLNVKKNKIPKCKGIK